MTFPFTASSIIGISNSKYSWISNFEWKIYQWKIILTRYAGKSYHVFKVWMGKSVPMPSHQPKGRIFPTHDRFWLIYFSIVINIWRQKPFNQFLQFFIYSQKNNNLSQVALLGGKFRLSILPKTSYPKIVIYKWKTLMNSISHAELKSKTFFASIYKRMICRQFTNKSVPFSSRKY